MALVRRAEHQLDWHAQHLLTSAVRADADEVLDVALVEELIRWEAGQPFGVGGWDELVAGSGGEAGHGCVIGANARRL